MCIVRADGDVRRSVGVGAPVSALRAVPCARARVGRDHLRLLRRAAPHRARRGRPHVPRRQSSLPGAPPPYEYFEYFTRNGRRSA